ncbi:RDD family protein [Microbacterium faecale]|nr:RDD family protein [Microbacterium faecale]
MSTGQEGYASQAYRPPGGAPEPRQKREAPRAETRAVASLGRRALVCLVDLAVIGAIGGTLGALAAAAIGIDALLTGASALSWLAAIPGIGLVLMLAYIVMQATGGSLAQRWFDVRIVRAETGERVGFGRALGRHVLWALAGVIVVGYFSPLFDGSGRRQGWHDKATGTLVVDVSESRAAVRQVAFAPLAPERDASAASAAAPDAPPQMPAASASAWAPVVPGHPAAPAHPAAPVAAPAPAAPQAPVASRTPVAPQAPAAVPAPAVPTAHPAPPAAPAVPPMPPALAPVAGAADSVPADTPAPPAAAVPSSHDSFAPPSPDESVVSDDTIALPPRDRRAAPSPTPTPNAVPRDPFAPPEAPAAVAQPDADPAPVPSPARDTVSPPPTDPAPPRADPAPPADPIDPMTVPVPPDEDIVDDTIVLNRRPAAPAVPPAPPAPAEALLSGDGFALTADAAGLSILRSTDASDISVTRGGAALDLALGTSVRLAAGDVLTIGDRSITVGGP